VTYATQQDLVTRFGEQSLIDLTDRADPPLGEIDAAVVAVAIADAQAEIDGYLAVRYALPVTVSADRLRSVMCDLVRYRLHGDRVTEEVRARFEDARAWLRDVSAGRVVLPGASAPGGASSPAQTVEVAAGRKVFGGGLL
jgi:phage gp36-like protein